MFLLIIAGVSGILWRFNNKGTKSTSIQKTLADVARNLNAEQKKIYTDKISKALEFKKSLNPSQENYKTEIVNLYTYLAQQYHGLGQLQAAWDYYQLALKEDPKNDQIFVGLSEVLNEAKDLNGAAQMLDQALEANPKNQDAWIRYINLRKTLGSSQQDINNLYFQALDKTGRNIDIVKKYATFMEEQGKYSEAVSLWQEAAKINPNSSALYLQEVARLQKLSK